MKKIILPILSILVFGFSKAQNKVQYGAKAGLTFSTFRGDLPDTSYKPGFVFGGFADIQLKGKWAIQPEVLYLSAGTDYNTNTYEGAATVSNQNSLNLGYLAVPVMVEFNLSKFSLEFGPQIGFLMFGKLYTNSKATVGDIITADSTKENVKDQFNSVDFCLNFGASYNFNANFFGNLRYNMGITTVNNNSDVTQGDSLNSVISFSFGYKFN